MRSIIILLSMAAVCPASIIYPGNDSETTISRLVGHEVHLLGKIETEGENLTYEGIGDQFNLNYTQVFDVTSGLNYIYSLANKDGESFMSGTITYEGDEDIDYYAVKAGKNFKLYEWDDGAEHQTWHTYDLCAAVSHISFYGVPEPSGFVIFGVGLLFLLRRFRC